MNTEKAHQPEAMLGGRHHHDPVQCAMNCLCFFSAMIEAWPLVFTPPVSRMRLAPLVFCPTDFVS